MHKKHIKTYTHKVETHANTYTNKKTHTHRHTQTHTHTQEHIKINRSKTRMAVGIKNT